MIFLVSDRFGISELKFDYFYLVRVPKIFIFRRVEIFSQKLAQIKNFILSMRKNILNFSEILCALRVKSTL